MRRMIPIVLTIAGSDSSGGAGIQADLKTFSALGTFGASVLVALTAQNTRGVSAIHPVPADFVAAQMDAVYSDLDVRATKIGMLATAELICTVAERLRFYKAAPVVDPVMIAASGARLLETEALDALRTVLLPQALLVTPNLPEAAALLNAPMAETLDDMRKQAIAIKAMGAGAVLIKGGHGTGPKSTDVLLDDTGFHAFDADRITTDNTHGTGCTLSSAIAAHLSHGLSLPEAVQAAKDYVTRAISRAHLLQVGHGHGPLWHF